MSVAPGWASVAPGCVSVAPGWASVAPGYVSVGPGCVSVAPGCVSVAPGCCQDLSAIIWHRYIYLVSHRWHDIVDIGNLELIFCRGQIRVFF